MSTLKVNNLQVGQDSTATNNLTWFQPGSPDGTIRLGSGNAGSATTKFTFDKDGNLTCVGNINAASILAPIEGTLDDWIIHAGDTNTKFGFPAADVISFETGGDERLRINSDGRIWINTQTGSSATELLRVENTGTSSTDSRVSIISGGAAQAVLLFGDDQSFNQGQIVYSNVDHSMRFHANAGNERLRINSAGTVRIKRPVSTTLDNDSIFLGIGDTENATNCNRMIGFGYNSNFGTSVYPASMGYTESDNSGNTKGALTFNTRNTTGATDAPVERLRIKADGDIHTPAGGRLFIGGGGSPTNLAGVQYSKLLVDVANNADYIHFRKNVGQNQPIVNITHNQDYLAATRYANSGDAWVTGVETSGNFIFSHGMGAAGGGGTTAMRISQAANCAVSMGNGATGGLGFNAQLTVKGDISGGLLMLKAAEDTNRFFVSGNNGSGVEVNLYDDAGTQRGVLVANGSNNSFDIKTPSTATSMRMQVSGNTMISFDDKQVTDQDCVSVGAGGRGGYNTTSNSSWSDICTFSGSNTRFSCFIMSQENSYSQMIHVGGSTAWNSVYHNNTALGDSGHGHSKDVEFRVINNNKLQFKNVSHTTTRQLQVFQMMISTGYVTWA